VRLSVLAIATLAVPLSAQGPTTVNGTVLNESARPIEHAQVTLDPAGASRQVRTDRDGRFSFLGVPAGSHSVRVTWVGYSPEERGVNVTGGVVSLEFTLRRLTTLDTVAVTGKRAGLYGMVVSRDSLLPVPGARIEVIGSRKSDSTGVDGRFNMPEIKPGSYLVRVKHPRFESRNVPVSVPVDGSVELDIVVDRGMISRDQHMEMLYREMDSRVTFKGQHAAMVTRDELRGREKMPLDMAVQYVPGFAKKAFQIPGTVCVFVDGVARPGASVYDFAVEDIEAIEFYGAPYGQFLRNQERALTSADPTGSLSNRWPPKTPCGNPTSGRSYVPPARSSIRVMFAVVWLRK